jgi:hypothetical protein
VLDDLSRRVGVLAKRAATAPSRVGVVCHDAADYQSGTIAEAQSSCGKHAAMAGESIRLHPPTLEGTDIRNSQRSPQSGLRHTGNQASSSIHGRQYG